MQDFGHLTRPLEEQQPRASLAVFSGHLFDGPHRHVERFPVRFAASVKASIRDWLTRHQVQVGISSAANGADLLFQEALGELGVETNIVLPYAVEEFIADTVQFMGPNADSQWEGRIRHVVNRASRLVIASTIRNHLDSDSYVFTNDLINGLALIRAQKLGTRILGLAVSDGKTGTGPGGAECMIRHWQQLQLPVFRIDLSHLPSVPPLQMPIINTSS